jgi:glycosyltransferase 2 family protein
MKLGVTIASLAGFSAMIALLVYYDGTAILGLVVSVGWGLVFIILVRGCTLVVAGMGWAKLVQPCKPVVLRVYLQLRWIRESINVLLPVAQVGGDLIGGRLLAFWGVGGGLAGASILVDLLIQVTAQLVFTLLGLALLAQNPASAPLIRYIAGGLVISAAALGGFYVAQRSGLMLIGERVLSDLTKRWPSFRSRGVPALHEHLVMIYRRPRVLFASYILHQAAWIFGVAEIWTALHCMGLKPGWGECLVLESLGQAVRSADFAIPGVMGVQEGGFLVLGKLYGIGPEVSLALSLVKRVPDLVLGVPGLFLWHLQETRQIYERRRASLPALAIAEQGPNDFPARVVGRIWAPKWTSGRKLKAGEVIADLFGFLTIEPNELVGTYHTKAIPVILTTREEVELLMMDGADQGGAEAAKTSAR